MTFAVASSSPSETKKYRSLGSSSRAENDPLFYSLAKRFSILKETRPSQHDHLLHSSSSHATVSIEAIRLRLVEQRQRAVRERGDQDGQRWFVTEEEEDIVLEELAQPHEEVPHTAPVGDFRRSPSDWSIGKPTSPTGDSLARSHSASATGSASLSSMANDPRMIRPGGHPKGYGILSGSQMRDKEIMRMAAARGAKMKKSGSDRSLDVVAEGDAQVTPTSSIMVGKWTPPISEASHLFALKGSALSPPSPPMASRRGARKSLLNGLSSASIKRISMALVEIEEELTATREVGSGAHRDKDLEVLEEVMTNWSDVRPLTPHRSNMSSLSSRERIGTTSSGHERKTSITRSPAYHDSLSAVAQSAPLIENRPPSPSPSQAPSVTRTPSDRTPNVSRKSSRAGRHNRQQSATSQLTALLPDSSRSAPIGHGRSASSSPAYPGVAPAPPATATRMRSSSITSTGAIPVSRDSLINGYVPGAARPFTPPRPAEGGREASPSVFGAAAAVPSMTSPSRIATARPGGQNRPHLFIKPGLTVSTVRAASGGRLLTVSPVVESFEVNEETPRCSACQQLHRPPHVLGHHRVQSVGSSPLASHVSMLSPRPRDEDDDAEDFTFDATAYYGQASPLRKSSLAEGLELLDTESREVGESTRPSSRTSLDSEYSLEKCHNDVESLLFPSVNTLAAPEVASHDVADDVWDITHKQLMTIQNKLVEKAKAVRLAISGPEELSPRPSPNPAQQQRPSTRLRRTEMSTIAMQEDVGQLELALSTSSSTAGGGTPLLQCPPTTSSTTSSDYARTPQTANATSISGADPTVTGRFPDDTINETADASFVFSEHQTPSREAKATPIATTPSPQSRDLADDPVIRKHFEDKIAQATAELRRNVSTSKVTRKNSRMKASHISSPQLLSSSSKMMTNPIASPPTLSSSQVESPRETTSAAERLRKLAGLGSFKDLSDSPIPSRDDPLTLSAPIKLKPVSSVRRAAPGTAVKEASMPSPHASSLSRGGSTGFRGLIGRLRTKGVTEPLFEEVTPPAESFASPMRDVARTDRRTALTNSVVRRTIIMPHRDPTSAPKSEPTVSTTLSRKPSTGVDLVKPLDIMPATQPDEWRPSLHGHSESSEYSQLASEGSILDMYLDHDSDGNAPFRENEVREAVEI